MISVAAQSFDTPESAASRIVPADWPLAEQSRIVHSFGTRWHVQKMGAGPTLLLIHGTAASTHSFRDLIPLLAANFTVVAFDLPGHGFSSRLPDADMSLPAIVRGIEGLLETLDLAPRYVAGHSAGAAIALQLALRGGGTIEAVVGLNAALLPFGGIFTRVFSPLASFFASTRLMPLLLARRATNRQAVERVIRGTGSVLGADGIEFYQRLFRSESHLEAVLAMMAAWDLAPLNRELPTLEARLLLIAGGRDRAVDPREAESVRSRLDRADVVRLKDCGHLAHEEAPVEVAGLIRDYCLGARTGDDAAD